MVVHEAVGIKATRSKHSSDKNMHPIHTRFKVHTNKDLGVHITKVVAWNTRKYAKVLIEGNDA